MKTMKNKQISSSNKQFAVGGKGHMFGEREAGPQKPGQTASGGQDAPESMWAKGGNTKMFGKQTASPAKPC